MLRAVTVRDPATPKAQERLRNATAGMRVAAQNRKSATAKVTAVGQRRMGHAPPPIHLQGEFL